MGLRLAIERQHDDRPCQHVAVEIDRLVAECEREGATVWREVLNRLQALEAATRLRSEFPVSRLRGTAAIVVIYPGPARPQLAPS